VNNTLIAGVISKMIKYFSTDVRRINHALKVYSFAKSIGELESLRDEKLAILETAAILHDIGIKESARKHNSTSGKYQEMEGPPVARRLLEGFSLPESFIDRVCYLIGHHHTYNKIDDIDFQILVEADFLVNFFEDDLKNEQIINVKNKYFKTKTGGSYLDSMYGIN